MAYESGKEAGLGDAVPGHETTEVHPDSVDHIDWPRGWKYRRYSLFGHQFWYASPQIQLLLVSFVCFMCPGMFNALGGLGGGGKSTPTLADNMNTALYSAFAVFGFFGGTIINKLGVKYTLAFGGLGYGVYAVSLLVSTHRTVTGFSIFAGVFLGICAGLLWTAQGTIMISYPFEEQKGRYFARFWAIFNLGAVIGSLIPLGENIHRPNDAKAVNDGTYIGFIVLMFFGAVLAMLLCNAKDIVRSDGSKVILMKHPSWQSEIVGLYETMRWEPLIFLLFPMFFVSNWFYVYQQNSVNGARFNVRTRALNSLLYWLAQIIAAGIWGYLLDFDHVRRSIRAKVTWVVLFILSFAIWGGGYAYEKQYTRASVSPDPPVSYIGMDWSDKGYVGPMFLYIFYGFFDAAWQASVYWFMGALSNSGRRSANYVGFYKGIQSVGAAVMNNLDSRGLAYKKEYISNVCLLGAALLFSFPIIFFKIKDHISVQADIKGTDETVEDVLPTGHEEKVVA